MKISIDDRSVALTDNQIEMFKKLSRLQQGMVLYTLEGDAPADAHKRAGGVCKTESHRTRLAGEILRKPAVMEFLDSVREARLERLADAIMSRDEMAERLTKIARTDVSDLMVLHNVPLFDQQGEIVQQGSWAFKDVTEMGGYGVGMISELTVGKMGTKVKLHDQTAAMKQLSTLMGYDKPTQVEHSGSVDANVTLTATQQKLIDKLLDDEY
ncbi:MAG: terminase small subunit [Plesiomonas sp.]